VIFGAFFVMGYFESNVNVYIKGKQILGHILGEHAEGVSTELGNFLCQRFFDLFWFINA